MKRKVELTNTLFTSPVNPQVIPFLVGLGILELNTSTNQFDLTDRITMQNMAICYKCNTFMYSEHRHDFVQCECPEEEGCHIDGGKDYFKRGAQNPNQFILPPRKNI
jgi:hypothetical protein